MVEGGDAAEATGDAPAVELGAAGPVRPGRGRRRADGTGVGGASSLAVVGAGVGAEAAVLPVADHAGEAVGRPEVDEDRAGAGHDEQQQAEVLPLADRA